MHSAAGGIQPRLLIPIVLDVGCNNAAIREDPLYLGLKQVCPKMPENLVWKQIEAPPAHGMPASILTSVQPQSKAPVVPTIQNDELKYEVKKVRCTSDASRLSAQGVPCVIG